MATHYLNASVRYTEAASKIESFLDDFENSLSPNIFHELNELAGEVEKIENNLNHEIEELRKEKMELEDEIIELNNKIESLEEDK